MYWIALPNGTTRRSKTLRIALAVAYFLMAAAGAFIVYSPIFREMYSWRIEIMAWFMLVGGTCAFLGTLTHRWVGEFTGLPLLVSAFAVFGVVTLREGWSASPWLSLGNACLLWSMSAFFTARWRVAFAFYRIALLLGKDQGHE